jgi:hypothetical protein
MTIKQLIGLTFLLFITWSVNVYHEGVLPPPNVSAANAEGEWIDKAKFGIHQLILKGNAYGRGLKSGELTAPLLRLQEQELTTKLFEHIPESVVKILEIPLISYFRGIEKFVEPWMLEEMYGVSKSAPKEFDSLIDSYTRQLAYHGVHEVGQMMVDQGGDDMGCTVVAAPVGKSWVLGRNFDFEGGQTLDREKILKWVFPDNGYAFVSVIWAGMVGAVTAVNEQGIYLSINAAGSADHRRIGIPTTLLLLKTLMMSKNAEEAINILRSEPTFITDIFVLLDSRAGKLYRIEKSPLATEVIPLTAPSVVTNHLISPRFAEDRVNQMRMKELTSTARSQRGEALLKDPVFSKANTAAQLELPILKIIRDKDDLHLGNRKAIDALIAVHAVVFNGQDQVLFVSQGPALAGPFVGFDLKKSFAEKRPMFARVLPRELSDEKFDAVRASGQMLKLVAGEIKTNHCDDARAQLEQVPYKESFNFSEAMGDFHDACGKDRSGAKEMWQQALDRSPAYAKEEERIRKKLEREAL